MPIQLKPIIAPLPADLWQFSDPHTGFYFPPMADINDLIDKVIEHRKERTNVYSPQDLSSFDRIKITELIMLQRVAHRPDLFEDSAMPGMPWGYVPPPPPPAPAERYVQAGKTCGRCGYTEFAKVYCQTCGGNRVSGYRCLKCGFES